MDHRLEANRRNWNERTPVHAASAFYDVAGFKAGRITLNDIERREVGPVAGKTLLHLQCHFGLDTMSWARLGATATGVDFSDAAIALARKLNAELRLGARFIRANVYDLPNVLREQFDVVYTATGVLCWLPDLKAWAALAARCVKPGGFLYLMDGHPFFAAMNSVARGGSGGVADLRVHYPYFPAPRGLRFPGGEVSYAGDAAIASESYEWAHSVEEILGAIQATGLRLAFFHEFPVSCHQAFPGMVRGQDGWWRFPERNDSLPQTFSLLARKPAEASGQLGPPFSPRRAPA